MSQARARKCTFPSPAGSSYFSINARSGGSRGRKDVSVPCGVFVFLNEAGERGPSDVVKKVSVPCGVFVFLNVLMMVRALRVFRFRPLRGLRISQSHGPRIVHEAEKVSVPCGVFVFLNSLRSSCKRLWSVSVPCGVFVFLNRYERYEPQSKGIVSVPCGVFVFLNNG